MSLTKQFRKTVTLFITAAATLVAVHTAKAVEALLLQDTYVDNGTSGKPPPNTTNNGAGSDLRVFKGNGRLGRSFIKFSVATLPPGTTAADITSARIRLWVNSDSTVLGSITLTPITNAWDELTLKDTTVSNLTFGAPKLADLPISYGINFTSIDVTGWVKAWLDGSLPNEGFMIEPSAGASTLNLAFDAKESNLTSHEPRLEISLSKTGPTGAAGAQGPAGPAGIAGPVGPGGAQGPPGLTGPKGDKGDTGVAGPQGESGPVGLRGPSGDRGGDGPQGLAGADGAKWFSGNGTPSQELGSANDYYLDSATANVWRKVTANADPLWTVQTNIRGPEGAAGPTGAAGQTGAQGLPGATGPQGLPGLPGSQGLAGVNGDTGPSGPQGPQGPAGEWPTRLAPQGDLSMGEYTQGPMP
ncbi:MAG: DNRLRE domain-containing protein [Chthoniobacterales bacterium]